MFDKFSEVAEKVATGMSRRSFVGSVGRWAGATTLGLAGVLATAHPAQARGGKTCCRYAIDIPGLTSYCYVCINGSGPCPDVASTNCPSGMHLDLSLPGCSRCR